MSDPDDIAISYKVLEKGTPVHASDGELIGTVASVLDNAREQIFDGIVIETPAGRRFVDAPEVARITEARVTLSLDSAQAAELPESDAAGGPEFRANPRAGRIGHFLGGGWRRDK
jgi:hypothetical protein